MALVYSPSIAQITQLNNIRPAGPAFNGWDGTGLNPGSLQIRNDFDDLIEFHTNNLLRMTVLGGPITSGFVGIGTPTPTRRLNVIDDIDLTSGTFPNSGYRWNDEIILKTDQIGNNIFLGLGCGKYQYFNI